MEELFNKLEKKLSDNVDNQYFSDSKNFKTLIEVLALLGDKIQHKYDLRGQEDLLQALKDQNPAYSRLLDQRKIVEQIIEGVVTVQHGGLNESMDTVVDVIKSYKTGKDDINKLRECLKETQSVLTAKKSGQIPIKDLWSRKVEAAESLRILNDLEYLKDANLRIQRFIQEKKYLSAVINLNKAINLMFNEDLVIVTGLSQVREQLLDIKENVFENVISELKDTVLGISNVYSEVKRIELNGNDSDSDDGQEQHNDEKKEIKEEMHVDDYNNTNLDEVDETVEAGLLDPSSSGSVFIRLLVKAVGVLGFEEDLERLLLENAHTKFLTVIKCYRDIATRRLRRKLSYHETGKSTSTIESLLFTKYVESLLDAAALALKRLLYVYKLLDISKKRRTGNILHDDNKSNDDNSDDDDDQDKSSSYYQMKDSNRKTLLGFWNDIELIIVNELKLYLREKEVEKISDNVSKNVPKSTQGSTFVDDNDESGNSTYDSNAIFNPSVRLTAPIYRKIHNFYESAKKLLIKEGLYKETIAIKLNDKILDAVESILEQELIPVIQSSINQSIRDIQLNSQYFSLSLTQTGNYSKEKNFADNDIPICWAAQLCARSAQPLFDYWSQLPQHRDMVITILDRLLSGFVSSAREELDSISYRIISSDNKYKNKIRDAMYKDSLFHVCRQSIFFGNIPLDELVSCCKGGNNPADLSTLVALLSKPTNSAHMSTTFNDSTSDVMEMSSWHTFWDVGSTPYAIPGDKVFRNFAAIGTIASILHGSDWLATQLCLLCPPSFVKKFQIGSKLRKKVFRSNNFLKQENFENIQLPLLTVILNGAKNLSLLAEEALALLRGEIQISCFYYLHKFAHLKHFTTLATNNGKSSGVVDDGSQEDDVIIAELNQYLLSFQDAVLLASAPTTVSVLLSPLCILIPRVLLNCIRHLAKTGTLLLNKGQVKTRILRCIVACQQCLSMLIEAAHLDPTANKTLQDLSTEEFERVRRYTSLLEVSFDELKSFMMSSPNDYTKEEFKTLFNVNNRSRGIENMNFEEIWNHINN